MTVLMIAAVVLTAGSLYLWMIMPRMLGRPDTAGFLNWLYAHRGLHDNASDAPENSLRAFERAAEAGFGIELDVQLTKDGVPVVFHDLTLERMCGAREKVCDCTFQRLQQFFLCGTDQRIPHLADVLKLVDGRVPLIVELKIAAADLAVCAAADRLLSGYQGMYCVESFHPLGVNWYRRNRPEVVRGQLSDAFCKEGHRSGILYFFLENLLFNWVGRPDFVAYNHRYPQKLSRRLCRRLYRSPAAAWTIKSAQELEQAQKYFDLFIFDSFVPEKETLSGGAQRL